ncbi:SLAM family member 9-like [Hemicordylus capensis]|uniref:SLAM family member 9-like n=1 Tax=Hemicordylus capensis TaxID=884348 RepID=UPI0023041097|nr:SLAM family member 9-like [Hemicordylus capensis]
MGGLWMVALLLLLLLLGPRPGSSAQDLPKKLIAAVGESVTFPLEIPPSFREILWNKNKVNIVTVEPGSPCQLLTFGDYRRRQVNVSKDCGSLTVTELRKEDSAEYTAQILVPGQQSPLRRFHLQVYKRLSEKDLDAACAKVVPGSGNETWQLNCSAGTWEEGVEFNWTSAIQSSSGRLLVIQRNLQEKDLNATCTAKNPIGNTSRTFSLRNTCVAPGYPTTRPTTRTTEESGVMGLSSYVPLGVTISLLLLAKVAISACVFVKWSSCTKQEPLETVMRRGTRESEARGTEEDRSTRRRAPSMATPPSR